MLGVQGKTRGVDGFGILRASFAGLGLALGTGLAQGFPALKPLTVQVKFILDSSANKSRGLTHHDLTKLSAQRETARRNFARSALHFAETFTNGRYDVPKDGPSPLPLLYLATNCINVVVTDTLGYDIDRHRNGGASAGPPSTKGPYYITFLGMRDSSGSTLEHEYGHHLSGDTDRRPPAPPRDTWYDLKVDFRLLWQANAGPVTQFREHARKFHGQR